MTKADLDLAYRTVSELNMYAHYIDQTGSFKAAALMRVAASLLEKMVVEAEAKENADG